MRPLDAQRLQSSLLIAALCAAGCADDADPRAAGGAGGNGGDATASSSASESSASSGGAGAGPACGDGVVDEGEACDDGNRSPFDGCRPDCTIVEALRAPPLEWTYFDVPGTQCMNGDTAGFAVSIAPDSPNLMIYLEGGGACFNDACDFSAFSIPFIPPPDGIFDRNVEQNPVRDWSMIYVPYCTGDIHGGDHDAELGGELRRFHGYTNIGKYLELWGATFPTAETVLLTGISAGGFGAGLNFSQVADAFGPRHQLVLIDDSGPPLSNDVIPPCLQQTFRDVWGLDGTVLAACGNDCSDPNDFATGALAHLASQYPEARLGVFSNSADLVIRTFMGFGWGNSQHDNCEGVATVVPASVYADGLLDLRSTYNDRASTFFVGQTHFEYNFGQNHTALRSPSFYGTIIDGTSLADWVAEVIAGDVVHVGP